MHTHVETGTRNAPSRSRVPALKVGSRVAFDGDVLRVLPEKTLLVMVKATGHKLRIMNHWFENGAKLRGGDSVKLAGTVTKVWESPILEHTPISLAVDGFVSARETIEARWLTLLP